IGDDNHIQQQLVVHFNRAVLGGPSTLKFQKADSQKFQRNYWMNIERPAILAREGIILNHDIVNNSIDLKPSTFAWVALDFIERKKEEEKIKKEAVTAIHDASL